MQDILPDRVLMPWGAFVVAIAVSVSARGQQEGQWPEQQKLLAAIAGESRLEFIETPLEQVVDFFATYHKIEIQFDQRALAEAKISPTVPITAEAKNMSLAACLLVVLREVGLVCVVQEGYLLITTPTRIQHWGGALLGLTTPKPPVKPGAGAAPNKVLDVLNAETSFDFIDTSLEDVVSFLKDCHKVPVFLDRKALAEADVRPTVRVTKSLRGISLRSVLLLMLRDLGLTCARQDEFLVITTPREAQFWGGSLASVNSPPKKIQQALTASSRLEFIDTPLEQVVEFLQSLHDIPIVIDRRALEQARIPTNVPITRHVKGVPLRSALRLALDPLELTYVIENEVLMITTEKSRNTQARQELNADAGAGTVAAFRVWKANTGGYSTVAQFIESSQGKVTLRKQDGTTVSVRLEQLSTEDQRWVQQRSK